MKITLPILFFPFLASGQDNLQKLLSRYNTHSIPYISVEELKMLQNNQEVFYILDAREPEEFKVSHLKNAQFAGYSTFQLDSILKKIKNKSAPIIVYCSLGIRSEKISEKLKKAGYTTVKNLYGGIFEWKNKGYPVFNSKNEETERVHAYSKNWSKWLKSGEKIY